MCGIVGYCSPAAGRSIALDRVRRATDLLGHRGPDAQGVRHGDGWALGNRRLAIIDLSSGAQPISDPDRRYHLTYNGELYNYRELRAELQALGFTFRTAGDTEVVLRAFQAWGVECLQRFVGMFGLGIWDAAERVLFVARDRLGIKPVYYAVDGDLLGFASETRALRAVWPKPFSINPDGLSSYLSFRYTVGPASIYRGISTLEPGHYLLFSDEGLVIRKYWELPIIPEPSDKGGDGFVDEFRNRFATAVRRRLISDVPVCCFLSGGLDSSLVAAEMCSAASGRVKTFAAGFAASGDTSDLDAARAVASYLGTDHYEILLGAQEYFDHLPHLVALRDAPLSVPNEVAIYAMSVELRKSATVVLSGEGADELFGGYGRIFRSALDFDRMQLLRGSSNLAGAAVNGLLENLRRKYGEPPAWPYHAVDHFLSQYEYCSSDERRRLLAPDLMNQVGDDAYTRGVFAEAFDRAAALNLQERYMWVFEKLHLVGLLQRLDSATMAASVEGRVPFVDHELVEMAVQMPVHYKMRWHSDGAALLAATLTGDEMSERLDTTKYLLRKAFSGRLPDSILARKKIGFPVPLGEAFRNTLYDRAKEVLLDRACVTTGILDKQQVARTLDRRQPGEELKVWMLLNLGLWAAGRA